MFSYANNFIGTMVLSVLDIFASSKISKKFFIQNFIENFRRIAWDCLPIVTLTIGSVAIIYSIHSAPEFAKRGLDRYIGGLIVIALVRETVPVMAALSIVTQYCTGMTAQIASMKVTEQIDALRMSGVSPVNYLLIPMILASLIATPLLNGVGIAFGSFVGFLATDFFIDTNSQIFLMSIKSTVKADDILLSIVKTMSFGLATSLISYTCGILTRGGSKAVGNSTRLAVVISFVAIMILDYIITSFWL